MRRGAIKGNTMAEFTSPYHSTDPTDPQVYHDYIDCPNGQQIDPGHKKDGTGGLPRCGSCERLDL